MIGVTGSSLSRRDARRRRCGSLRGGRFSRSSLVQDGAAEVHLDLPCDAISRRTACARLPAGTTRRPRATFARCVALTSPSRVKATVSQGRASLKPAWDPGDGCSSCVLSFEPSSTQARSGLSARPVSRPVHARAEKSRSLPETPAWTRRSTRRTRQWLSSRLSLLKHHSVATTTKERWTMSGLGCEQILWRSSKP